MGKDYIALKANKKTKKQPDTSVFQKTLNKMKGQQRKLEINVCQK